MYPENSGGTAVANAPKQNRERLDMRLDPDIRKRAGIQAERFGMSLSAYIRSALVKKVEEDEQTEPTAKPPKRK